MTARIPPGILPAAGVNAGRPPLGYNGVIMTEMTNWTLIVYLQAGAYIAIMIAVFGGPQMLSSYFEARNRRADRLENESNAERRHREVMDAEARREERRLEERRQETEAAERRHQELMTALIAAISNGRNQGGDQSRIIETLLQRVEALESENARLRQQNGNGNPPPQAPPGE